MLKDILKKCRALLFAAALLAAASGTAHAVDLVAGTVDLTMPDGTVVTMWGFGPGPDGPISVPGPELTAANGETLTINLTNYLPVPVSISIRGLGLGGIPTPVTVGGRVRSFTSEAAANGGSASYSFTARAGTYLYESGTDPAAQVPMGLYGALTVTPASGGTSDATILFSEVDPVQNGAVFGSATGISVTYPPGTVNYAPKYFLINGVAYDPLNPLYSAVYIGTNTDTALLRLINAGSYTRMPSMQGVYMTEIAEDGYAKTNTQDRLAVFLPAGTTKDVLVGPLADGSYPLIDRRLYVSNAGSYPGGMIASLIVANEAPLGIGPPPPPPWTPPVPGGGGGGGGNPVLLSPADGASLPAGTKPTYTWSGTAGSSFMVEFSRDPLFGAFRAFSAGTATEFTPRNIQWRRIKRIGRGGRTVYWRVKETTTGGDTLYSDTRSFVIVR